MNQNQRDRAENEIADPAQAGQQWHAAQAGAGAQAGTGSQAGTGAQVSAGTHDTDAAASNGTPPSDLSESTDSQLASEYDDTASQERFNKEGDIKPSKEDRETLEAELRSSLGGQWYYVTTLYQAHKPKAGASAVIDFRSASLWVELDKKNYIVNVCVEHFLK